MRERVTSDTGSHYGGFLLGLVCGAAVGAAVGLLCAPKSGSQLRQQLAASTGRLRQSAVKGYETVVERGQMAARQGLETYDQVRQAATSGAHEVVKAAAGRGASPTAP